MEEEIVKTEGEATEKSKKTISEAIGGAINSVVEPIKEFANGLELKDVGLGMAMLAGTTLAVKGAVDGVKAIAENPKVKPKLEKIEGKFDSMKKTIGNKTEAVKQKLTPKKKAKSEPKETPAQEESNEE